MGQRASQLSDLVFEDCPLPPEALLGQEGEGFKNMMIVLEKGRIGIAALSVGIARAALEESLNYAKTHLHLGQPISKSQTNSMEVGRDGSGYFCCQSHDHACGSPEG